ncbi:hypothetical protein [Eggerthella sinensis]|uniref:hypothetical protein n=1 Tax=Eggerthella sinensis TaxID=242230 RepID=UPI00248D9E87|nr:hypothetical protein [Eggerthella sinensis]
MIVSRESLYRLNPGAIRKGLGLALLFWSVTNVIVAVLAGFGIVVSTIDLRDRLSSCALCLLLGVAFFMWGRFQQRRYRLAREYDGLIGRNATDISEIAARKDVPPSEVIEDLAKLNKSGFLTECSVDYDSSVVRREEEQRAISTTS